MTKNLSIVILSYNHAAFLCESLLRALSLSDIANVIVIDDASTDGSAEILCDKKFSNIKVIIKEENKGLIDSHQIWLQFVNSEYVYLIASDDLINVSEFREAYNIMCNNECIDVGMFGGINFDNESEWPIYSRKHKRFFDLSPQKQKIEIFSNHPSPLLIQSSIFKTRVLKSINAFDGKVRFDDYPIFIKIISNIENYNLIFNDSISIVNYRHHDTNTYKNLEKMFCMFEEVYYTYCENSRLRVKSIALVWWLYILRSIKNRQFDSLTKIVKKGKFSYFKYVFIFIYGVLMK